MKHVLLASGIAVAFGITALSPAAAQEIGPTPYLSQADSPFNPASFATFYLEDFEDGALNTPGLSASSSCVSNTAGCFLGVLIDSVGNNGDQTMGHSLFAGGSITLTFDAAVLGSLPTAAGLVWTDGANPITFEAFDENGVSLGTITGTHADGSIEGTTAEDRFYGAINSGGISRLTISDPAGIEIDHVQYGLQSLVSSVPEPATWAMMLAGFGAVGWQFRRKRPALVHAAG
jgi:PEP-CTERM motif-containing protein